jgi:hypothetical protein
MGKKQQYDLEQLIYEVLNHNKDRKDRTDQDEDEDK